MSKVHGNYQFNAAGQIASYYQDTGVANAYEVAMRPPATGMTEGLTVKFIAANPNTGASTLDVGFGPFPIKKDVTANLTQNDILAGGVIEVTFDGTNFQWTSAKFGSIQAGLAFGGQVTWLGGYSFNIAAAGYFINFQYFTSPSTNVTLSAPDLTFNRIDVFIVDNTGSAGVVQGTPSATPTEPALDLGSQIRLSATLVEVGTTEPPITQECIYLENTEWTTAEVSGGRINPASTATPHSGVRTVRGVSVNNNDYVTFTTAAFLPVPTFTKLNFWLKAGPGWGVGQRLSFQWYNGASTVGSAVNIQPGTFGFITTNTTTYQILSVPLSSFGLVDTSTVTTLRITLLSSIGALNSFYLDDMCLHDGEVTPSLTLPGFQNGLIYNAGTNTVEFGSNPLIHNTTLYTAGFVQTFSGATIYDYPYQFSSVQGFQNGTGMASFKNAGSVEPLAVDYNNTVRFGINYTGDVYDSMVSLPGYLGDKIGYWIGVNITGNGSYGLRSDNANSKVGGIFFHTLDTAYTDIVTIFGKHSPNTSFVGGLATKRIATFHDNGGLTFWKYGLGSFTGTLAKGLGVTSSGQVIEYTPGLGTTYTVNNGLTASTATNFQLGGPLIQDTSITGAFSLSLTNPSVSYSLGVTNSGGGLGTTITTTGGGMGLFVNTTGNVGAGIGSTQDLNQPALYTLNVVTAARQSTLSKAVQFGVYTSGTPAAGFGGIMELQLKPDGGPTVTANEIKWVWTDPTAATPTSQLYITGLNGGITNTLFVANGDGSIGFPQYGVGTFDNTPTRLLGVLNDGTIIETDPIRFAVVGEDDTANETREFNLNGITQLRIHDNDSANPLIAVGPNGPFRGSVFSASQLDGVGPDIYYAEIGLNTSPSLNQAKIELFTQIPTGNALYITMDGDQETILVQAGNGITLDGPLKFADYGIGTFDGTPNRLIGVSGVGDLVEYTVPVGYSGVRLDIATGRLGLGRLTSDTGNTQGTIAGDSEVLLNTNSFRFIDTSSATITKTATFEGSSGNFLALNRTDVPVVSKASNEYTLRVDTIENLAAGAVMKPQGVLFNTAWRLNGNVTTDNLEHEYNCNYFLNHVSTTGGFAGGNITFGSLGMNTVMASLSIDDNFTGTLTGSCAALATRLKVSRPAGGISVDIFKHLLINTHFVLNGTNTINTHIGIYIESLKSALVTTAFAIDQVGTSDRNRFAGPFELITAFTPASTAASGNTGTICWDENYIYWKTASNGWKRILGSTF